MANATECRTTAMKVQMHDPTVAVLHAAVTPMVMFVAVCQFTWGPLLVPILANMSKFSLVCRTPPSVGFYIGKA